MCQSPYLTPIRSAAIRWLILLGVASFLWTCNKEPMQKKPPQIVPAATEVLIKFKPGVPEDSVRALATTLGLEQVRELREIGVRVFRTTSRVSVEQVLRASKSSALIEYAEPNSTVKIPEKN
jgi:hypothetical protein